MSNAEENGQLNGSEVAVIGLTCRFPGARNYEEFWRNLCEGVETISFLSDDEIEPSLVDPISKDESNYVKAASLLEGADLFDAQFFGLTPREAEVMDPQHRVFLECAWEALEQAGYDPESYRGAIGVFAGARTDTYVFNLFSNSERVGSLGAFEIGLGNDLAFLSTRVSYKLNLRGPSYSIHTACSTSLVAVHLACQSLLINECQMALAGGVAINTPQKTGYLYQHGGIVSPDGHCRAFDARAQGTVFGSGVGIVVLKRLEDALADGDKIYAVVKGSATNNDGSDKASFTAPSVHGQSDVIAEAMAAAGVDPETISYVETHGTGTALGDPIEIRGLTKTFRRRSSNAARCAIGSVKTNFGHLDAAAGIASFIKTALALDRKQLPPSLHYSEPNPNIDFGGGLFYVNSRLTQWERGDSPRRAGISSFGVGGTNAHVILEEAPAIESSGNPTGCQLLVLSARTETALDNLTANLTEHLQKHPEINLADAAFTLQLGRRPFANRRIVVASEVEEAVRELQQKSPDRVFDGSPDTYDRPVVFMFPGGGAQYAGMGRELYESVPSFRAQVDESCHILEPSLGYDLREALFSAGRPRAEISDGLNRTSVALPALFVIEHAVAKLLMSWGVRPEAMIGHSLGEYVAACLAGVFTLEDALAIVVLRGRLFERLPKGAMLSVTLPEKEALSLMNGDLSLAAINGPSQCVMSGPIEAISEMAVLLEGRGVEFRQLHIDVAAHSKTVEPILEEFARFVVGLTLNRPAAAFISNVTGTWITDEQAVDPQYWASHLRHTVRFADGLEKLMKEPARLMLEVGPGQTLSTLAKLQAKGLPGSSIFSTMRHPYEQRSDQAFLLTTLGKLWMAGVKVDWRQLHASERRQRTPLPTYPFERQRYWIDSQSQTGQADNRKSVSGKNPDISAWFYIPSWRRTVAPLPAKKTEGDEACRWLVFVGQDSLAQQIVSALKAGGREVVTAQAGEAFSKIGQADFVINPRNRDDYLALIEELRRNDELPGKIAHLWSLTESGESGAALESFERAQERGYYSLLFLAQALAIACPNPLDLWVISNGAQEVESCDQCFPEKATMLGPLKVVPQELQSISSHLIDIVIPETGTPQEARLVEQLLAEMSTRPSGSIIAYRGGRRMAQVFEPAPLDATAETIRPIRQRGVYLITGGLGGVGLLLGRYLAESVQARLALVGRSPLPDPREWDAWLATHDEDDLTARRLRAIRQIEAAGGEVMLIVADVTDDKQMECAVAEVYERFGDLNGVIHAAGITSGPSVFTPLTEIGSEESESQFGPKVRGVYALAKALGGKELDFCLMTSSNSSVLGGMGLVAYSAANAFMDSFASSSRNARLPWISSSWDPWPEETKRYSGVQTSMDRYTMSEQQSREAFRRIITMIPEGHVVVATGDLPARLDLWTGLGHASSSDSPSVHPRPSIRSAYAAPRNETEQAIAELWKQMLGVDAVGIYDNFFDLGGHSLLATRLVARLRDMFKVNLPLQKFFEAPHVAGLASAVASFEAEQEEAEKSEILELLAGLSDEEIETELNKRK